MQFRDLVMVAAQASSVGGGAPPPAPTITSSATGSVAENSTLAFALTANQSVTWSITGGVDAARFEISGSTLRWAGNGTKDFELPDDANADNAYIVLVTATNATFGATNQSVTITVTDVVEGGGGAAGPNSSAASADLADSLFAWDSPENVAASDDTYATTVLSTGDTSNFLRAGNFGFAIPGGATITGVLVEVEGNSDVSKVTIVDAALAMNSAGDATDQFGFPTVFASGVLASTDGYHSLGGTSDLWGASLTPAIINDPNFSVDFRASKSNAGTATVSIDHVRVSVSYT